MLAGILADLSFIYSTDMGVALLFSCNSAGTPIQQAHFPK